MDRKHRQRAARAGTSLLILFQLMFGSMAVALADTAPTPDPTASPTPTVEASPSPTPEASVAPTPSPSTTPDPTPTVSPDPSLTPVASPSPDASPATSPDPTPTATASTPAAASTTGPTSPTGPGKCTGVVPKWVFDTAKQLWSLANQASFVCDLPSGYYLSPLYYYDKNTGWYEIIPPDAPKPANLITAPNVIHTVLGDIIVGSQDYQMASALGLLKTGPDGIIVAPGTSSSSSMGTGGVANVGSVSNGQTWLDLTNLVTIINALDSSAQSGNADASKNTTVGDISSGTANVIGNLINLLAAAWSWSNGNLSYFMQNFFGNQSGNVLLDPTQAAPGGGGQLGATTSSSDTLNVKAQSTGSIVNNVDLSAQSGNALASANTTVGNVTSGAATAQMNILNLISTIINSGNSFFGILNIFGSLNGNILFPNGFFDGLVPSSASLSAPGSSGSSSITNTNTATINNTATTAIANNITTTAASGTAAAGSNTSAGTVASGAAATTQGLFNLANTSLFGDNAVLVIVNVMGHWVGKIMNMPGGSTSSALLTSNAQTGALVPSISTGPDSTSTTTINNTNTANIDQNAVGSITNNVSVGAQSGDALATKNSSVGNVASGQASAASSVANIVNSVLNVKHWFGVLIINVFGSWVGNVDTAKPEDAAVATVPSASVNETFPAVTAALRLIPASPAPSAAPDSSGSVASASVVTPHVVVASAQTPDKTLAVAKGNSLNLILMLSALFLLLAGALFSVERKLVAGAKRP